MKLLTILAFFWICFPSFATNDFTLSTTLVAPAVQSNSPPQLVQLQATISSNSGVSVKFFGAYGNGVSNDTAAIQAAVDSGAGIVFFPPGVFIAGPININHGLVVKGSGRWSQGGDPCTVIKPPTPTADVFDVNTFSSVTFQDFTLLGNPQTAGIGIRLDCTNTFFGVGNFFSSIQRVHMDGMYTGVQSFNALTYELYDDQFWNIVSNGTGCILNNTYNADQGDADVYDCTFGGGVSSVGITWEGGDGAKIHNNKFLTPLGLNVNLSIGQAGGQLYIQGNSFDQSVSAINIFKNTDDGFSYSNIQIEHNMLFAYGATPVFINVSGNTNSPVNGVSIGNNQVFQYGGSIVNGGIQLRYVSDFIVHDNLVHNNAATAGWGLFIDSTCSTGTVCNNEISGWTTAITNMSSSVAVRNPSNSGAVTGATNGVWIAHGLSQAPTKIQLTGSSSNAVWTSSINITNFVVGMPPNTTQTVYWTAEE